MRAMCATRNGQHLMRRARATIESGGRKLMAIIFMQIFIPVWIKIIMSNATECLLFCLSLSLPWALAAALLHKVVLFTNEKNVFHARSKHKSIIKCRYHLHKTKSDDRNVNVSRRRAPQPYSQSVVLLFGGVDTSACDFIIRKMKKRNENNNIYINISESSLVCLPRVVWSKERNNLSETLFSPLRRWLSSRPNGMNI